MYMYVNMLIQKDCQEISILTFFFLFFLIYAFWALFYSLIFYIAFPSLWSFLFRGYSSSSSREAIAIWKFVFFLFSFRPLFLSWLPFFFFYARVISLIFAYWFISDAALHIQAPVVSLYQHRRSLSPPPTSSVWFPYFVFNLWRLVFKRDYNVVLSCHQRNNKKERRNNWWPSSSCLFYIYSPSVFLLFVTRTSIRSQKSLSPGDAQSSSSFLL